MNNEYMHKLIKKFETNFNIQYNRQFNDINFDFTGEFNQRSAKYMFLKSAEIYAFKNHEYVFYKDINYNFNVQNIEIIKTILEKNINEIIKLEEEHMSSIITFIFSSSKTPDLDAEKAIKNFKFYKSFCFGFKGWVNVKLIFINSDTNEVITNRFAKGSEKFFQKLN